MNPFGLRSRQWAKLCALAEEVREVAHRGQRFIVDEEGYSHARGGAYGNGEREAFGYTLAETKRTRTLLRKEGVDVSIAEAEGYLQAALVAIDGGARYTLAMTTAERQAKHKASKPDGECRTCTGMTENGRRYCAECNRKAADRVRRRRERIRREGAAA